MNSQPPSPSRPGRSMPRLMAPWAILALAGVLVLVGVLLFPKEEGIDQQFENKRSDHLSIEYLSLALKNAPDNPALRMKLARQQATTGQLDKARQTLQPLLTTKTKLTGEARLFDLELAYQAVIALPAKSEARKSATASWISAVEQVLATPHPAREVLEDLSSKCYAQNRLAMVARVAEMLAQQAHKEQDTEEELRWLVKAAQVYLENQQPRRAADTYVVVAQTARGNSRSQYAQYAMTYIKEADDPRLVRSFCQRLLRTLPEDRLLLDQARVLALACGEVLQSAKIGRKRLKMDPEDPALIEQQLGDELAAHNLPHALELAQKLVRLRPRSAAAHEQLAKIAEWQGQPRLALKHWRWLARHTHQKDFEKRALALSKGTWDVQAQLELFLSEHEGQELNAQQLSELMRLYLNAGRPEEALQFLAAFTQKYPRRQDAWLARVDLQGQLRGAQAELALWREIDQRFGRTVKHAGRQATLLWKLGKLSQAVQTLRDVKSQAAAGDEPYWRMLGDLAWEIDATGPALEAYQKIWRLPRATIYDADKLALLHSERGNGDRALQVMIASFKRFRRGSELVIAAFFKVIDQGKWEKISKLEALAKKYPFEFQQNINYWELIHFYTSKRAARSIQRRELTRASKLLKVALRDLDAAPRQYPQLKSQPGYRKTFGRAVMEFRRQQLDIALIRKDHKAAVALLDLYQRDLLANDVLPAKFRAEAQTDIEQLRVYLALQAKNKQTIAQLYKQLGDRMPLMDRVDALQEMNRGDEALALLISTLSAGAKAHDRAKLEAMADELVQGRPRTVAGHASMLHQGALWLGELGGSVEYHRGSFCAGGGLSGRMLRADEHDTHDFAVDAAEGELSLFGCYKHRIFTTKLTLGGNFREASSMVQGLLLQQFNLGPAVYLSLRAGLNQLTTESSILRAVGFSDLLALFASFELPHKFFAELDLSGEYFTTRELSHLGHGFTGILALGYRMLQGTYNWNARVIGRTAQRAQVEALPEELVPYIDQRALDNGVVIPGSGSTIELATTFSRGQVGVPLLYDRHLRYYLELAGGWLAPFDLWTYRINAGLGLPLFGRDELSLTGEVANVQNTTIGDAMQSITLRYAHSLW